jgi:hypothetical protein
MSEIVSTEDERPRWLNCISVLLTTGSTRKAAEAAGVHPDTVSRWKRDPAFDTLYRQELGAHLETQRGEQQALVSRAIAVLREAMGEEHDIRTRIVAAKIVLTTPKAVEAPTPPELYSNRADIEGLTVEELRAAARRLRPQWGA